jgi:Domain of unknown function (DUF4157)
MRTALQSAAPVPAATAAPLQMKTRLGPVDDPLEREADRVADAVVAGRSAGTITGAPAAVAQRKCLHCEEEEARIQRKCGHCAAVETDIGDRASSAARAVSQGGTPLTAEQRSYFEPRFRRSFADVRIHSGGDAAKAARDINARAFTVGSNIAFAAGEHGTQNADSRLLAHELAHVVQQSRGTAMVQRWAACSEANFSAEACPAREAGDVGRAKAGMVFFAEMHDSDTGQTGALIANFDIGKSTVKPNLASTIHWQQFLQLTQQGSTTYKLMGFDDCHEAKAGGTSLRKARAEAIYQVLPPGLRPQFVSREAAPDGACMTPNVSGADRTLNRSVALVLDTSIADFSDEEEGGEVIIGKTPLDHMRECEAGARIKTFPFRTTRFGGAPIMAHRDGDEIVVKLPMHVHNNSDFRKENDTLPTSTFLNGAHLPKDEIVRVRHFELPHWYNFNLTGDATDDNKTDYCVPAEKLLDFASATNKAFVVNVAVTGVDALMLGTPVGKLAGTGMAKVAAPVTGLAQKTTVAGMLALREAAPTALAGRASAAYVEGKVGQQVASQAVSRSVVPAVAAPVTEATVAATVPRIGTSVAGDLAPGALVAGGAELGGAAINAHWWDFMGEARKRIDAAKAKYGDSGAVMMAGTGRTIFSHAEMRAFVESVFQQNPVLQQLARGQGLAGAAQHEEMLKVLHEFYNSTRIAYEVVDDGIVQAATNVPGNFASLNSKPGLLQIEQTAFDSPVTLTAEVTHELSSFYARVNGVVPRLEETYDAMNILELMIQNGGRYPF